MSRDRGGTVHVRITPDFSGMQEALAKFARATRTSMEETRRIFEGIRSSPIPHSRRYWHGTDGRVRRTPGMKPLLHNGGKP